MDEHRVDQTVKLGDTEQWTIVNADQQFHSFHIHQTAFLVTLSQRSPAEREQFATPSQCPLQRPQGLVR
jgi:FtsP/CotA-like multicopper oxidase with cupredoxin domain